MKKPDQAKEVYGQSAQRSKRRGGIPLEGNYDAEKDRNNIIITVKALPGKRRKEKEEEKPNNK